MIVTQAVAEADTWVAWSWDAVAKLARLVRVVLLTDD